MSVADVRKQLDLGTKDIAAIRRMKSSNWMLMLLLGAITSVATFIAGYSYSREKPGYPYGSVALSAVTLAAGRRSPWAIALVLAVLAFFSYNIGVLAGHPTFGEGSYYGVWGKKT